MVEPKDIIEKIKKEKIKPRPKWEVLFKNYAYWGIMGAMILFGAAVLSITLAGIFDLCFDLLTGFSIGKYFHLIIITMPLAWIILGATALFFGIMVFRKTKHGYRYRNLFIAAILVLIISVLALLAQINSFSKKIESAFDENVPRGFYKITPPKESRFFRPEEGLIAGRIIQAKDEYFILVNHREEQWEVIILDNTKLVNISQIREGLKVFVSGQKIDEKSFRAFVVRLFERPGMGNGEKNGLGKMRR